MNVIEILEKLVSFNTIEDKQNKEIIRWIESYLRKKGFNCKKVFDENLNKSCLVAEIGKNPIIAFTGHLDTIGITEDWNKNPFKLSIEDGKAYGLGVCDMKSGIAAFLKACSGLHKKNMKNGLKLYFTFDEELNFSGIKLLLKNKEKFPQYIILSEPTDLKPVVATKGCMEMKVKFYGKSSHSSTPNKGKNAILEANKFITELISFADELKKEENSIFPIPYTTINIGKIKGGDAVNMVPDRCYVRFDVRTINERHNKIIEKRVNEILKKYDAKLEIGINIKSNINNDNKMISQIEAITGNKRRSENFVTEASFIPDSETVILGAGPTTAHQSDEYIEIDKLNKLVEIYKEIIEMYCY